MATCPQCGSEAVQAGFCRHCWARQLGRASRKYHWTPELREELRACYAAGRKQEISAALDRLQRRLGWPRYALKNEAVRTGIITADHRRAWTAEEQAYLEESLGVVSVKQIARRLGRTVMSVESRAEKLGLSRRISEGYNMADLAAVFGESYHKVRRWMERGLLGPVHQVQGHRVAETHVVRFIRAHAHEYDLRRVDQGWYKSMVFGHLAEYGDRV